MIKLESFDNKFLKATYDWLQDSKLKKKFFLRKEITWQNHLTWFDSYKSDSSQKMFAILDNQTHCGNCGFKNINTIDEKAEMWIYLGNEKFQGKGLASNALKALLNYGFSEMKLNKIYLHVDEFNKKAIALYEKHKFNIEGYFINEIKIEEKYLSIYRMYLLKSLY